MDTKYVLYAPAVIFLWGQLFNKVLAHEASASPLGAHKLRSWQVAVGKLGHL